jgi:hypothetical protein
MGILLEGHFQIFSIKWGQLQTVDWAPNVLVGWIAGHGPALADAMEDDELKAVITKLFRDMHLNASIPEPRQIIR